MHRSLTLFFIAAAAFLILRCAWSVGAAGNGRRSQRFLAVGGSGNPRHSRASTNPAAVCQGDSAHEEAGAPPEKKNGGDASSIEADVTETLKGLKHLVKVWAGAVDRYPNSERLQVTMGLQYYCFLELGALSLLVKRPLLRDLKKVIGLVTAEVGRIVNDTPTSKENTNRLVRIRQLRQLLKTVHEKATLADASLSFEERRERLAAMRQIHPVLHPLIIKVFEDTTGNRSQSAVSQDEARSAMMQVKRLLFRRKRHLYMDSKYGPYLESIQQEARGYRLFSAETSKKMLASGPPPSVEEQIAELQAEIFQSETTESEQQGAESGDPDSGPDDPKGDGEGPTHSGALPDHSDSRHHPRGGSDQPESGPHRPGAGYHHEGGGVRHAASSLSDSADSSSQPQGVVYHPSATYYPGDKSAPTPAGVPQTYMHLGARPKQRRLPRDQQSEGEARHHQQTADSRASLRGPAGSATPTTSKKPHFKLPSHDSPADSAQSLEERVESLSLTGPESQEPSPSLVPGSRRWSSLRHRRSEKEQQEGASASATASEVVPVPVPQQGAQTHSETFEVRHPRDGSSPRQKQPESLHEVSSAFQGRSPHQSSELGFKPPTSASASSHYPGAQQPSPLSSSVTGKRVQPMQTSSLPENVAGSPQGSKSHFAREQTRFSGAHPHPHSGTEYPWRGSLPSASAFQHLGGAHHPPGATRYPGIGSLLDSGPQHPQESGIYYATSLYYPAFVVMPPFSQPLASAPVVLEPASAIPHQHPLSHDVNLQHFAPSGYQQSSVDSLRAGPYRSSLDGFHSEGGLYPAAGPRYPYSGHTIYRPRLASHGIPEEQQGQQAHQQIGPLPFESSGLGVPGFPEGVGISVSFGAPTGHEPRDDLPRHQQQAPGDHRTPRTTVPYEGVFYGHPLGMPQRGQAEETQAEQSDTRTEEQ